MATDGPSASLALDAFHVDETSHITVDPALCAECTLRPCLRICSAACFRPVDGTPGVAFDHAGCLECGTCRVVCRALGNGGVIGWRHPGVTFGVSYRYG